MERLNNIIKTTQRSHMGNDQRALPQQHSAAAGQRQPVPSRRPAEGHARPEPGSREGYYTRPALPAPRVPEPPEEEWVEPARPVARAHYGSQGGLRPTARYSEQPPQGDYYAVDEYPATGAEYEEEWDGTADMRYGDWESEQGYTASRATYHEESGYIAPAPRPRESQANPPPQRPSRLYDKADPLVTRELRRVLPEQTRPPAAVREQREARLPVPAPGTQMVPVRQPQRTTQPLKAQQVERLQTEMQRASRAQKPVLPETARESSASDVSSSATGLCTICKGAGFLRSNVPFGHPQFGKAVACQCKEQERKRKRRSQLLEISNLGAFNNKRFDTFNSRVPGLQEAFQVSMRFARSPSGWLFLVGPNGCGKTHLAAAVANECLESGAVVLFATVPDLLDHLRGAFAPDSSEVFDQLFARMREAEVLVLDDLGTQQSSPWASEKLFQLLNYRYNSGFPTVITANPKGFQATDERIRSRLSDIGLVITLNLDRARDYRPHNPHRE